MTNEFKELTSLLAKGNNFPENAFVLGVITDVDEDNFVLSLRGKDNKDGTGVLAIIRELIKEYLYSFNDEDARFVRDALLKVFADDERRRMGEKDDD